MTLNRRHKAILFTTLVFTGSGLLAGVDLRTALGSLMLGVALAWAVGSDLASNSYSKLKALTATAYLWTKLLLAMTFAGLVLGTGLVCSHANPVVAVGLMTVVGVLIVPFTSIPTRKICLKIPILMLAPVVFFLADVGVLVLDKSAWESNGERLGNLTAIGFFALLAAVWWVSKGWKLIVKGIAAEDATMPPEEVPRSAVGQYVSMSVGVLVLTLWVGLLAWSASSDWAYGARGSTVPSGAQDNSFKQFVMVILLASWPYASWRTILQREPNSEPRYVRRHKATVAISGMLFTVALCFAVTFGSQNGHDRIVTGQFAKVGGELNEVATKIGGIKQRDLKTTADYIQAYSEIEQLQPDFESKVQEYRDVFQEARRMDESRGPINIQRFYKSHTPDFWKNDSDMLEVVYQVCELTKQETIAVKNMAALPEQDQVGYWQNNFRPFIGQEDALREKILALQTKTQPKK